MSDITTEYDEKYIRNQHPEHEVVKDKNGNLRWKSQPSIEWAFEMRILDLNELPIKADKSMPEYRKLYRDLGYSLFGYWEVFYWEMNN